MAPAGLTVLASLRPGADLVLGSVLRAIGDDVRKGRRRLLYSSNHVGDLSSHLDPLIGDCGDSDRPGYMSFPGRRGGLERTAALPRFVMVRGAAYLFMPSMTAEVHCPGLTTWHAREPAHVEGHGEVPALLLR